MYNKQFIYCPNRHFNEVTVTARLSLTSVSVFVQSRIKQKPAFIPNISCILWHHSRKQIKMLRMHQIASQSASILKFFRGEYMYAPRAPLKLTPLALWMGATAPKFYACLLCYFIWKGKPCMWTKRHLMLSVYWYPWCTLIDTWSTFPSTLDISMDTRSTRSTPWPVVDREVPNFCRHTNNCVDQYIHVWVSQHCQLSTYCRSTVDRVLILCCSRFWPSISLVPTEYRSRCWLTFDSVDRDVNWVSGVPIDSQLQTPLSYTWSTKIGV